MSFVSLIRMGVLIALRRTAADWRLQSAAGFGMVLAVALMAASVIYSNALRETALDYTLRTAERDSLHLVISESHALDSDLFQATNEIVVERISKRLSPYIDGSALQIETSTIMYSGLPQFDNPASGKPHRGPVYSLKDVQEHLRVIEGRLPSSESDALEVVTDLQGATALGLAVGDRFHALPAVADGVQPLSIQLTGLIEPIDPEATIWRLGFASRSTRTDKEWITLPLYADGKALFDTMGTAFPNLYTNYRWTFFVDHEGLRAVEAARLKSLLPEIRRHVFVFLSIPSWTTGIEAVLDRFVFLLTLARIPLFLLVFLAIGVLLYYLFLIAGLMGRIRASEVAVFRSRGASGPQVGFLILLEGLLLAAPAVIIGPFLAQGLVLLTGRFFSGSSSTSLSFVTLSPEVFLLGAVGALLGVAVLTATTLGSSRHGIIEFGRAEARPPDKMLLHRYYLDFALLGFMAFLWWQLKSRNSVLIQPLENSEVQIDITLLLGPVLGTLAVGLVLLRIFPVSMRIFAWLTEPWGPVWLIQGIRRVARDPVPAGSLLVLVGLATSLGVLSSAFITTLERSQEERARYQAGADFRIEHNLGFHLASGRSPAATLMDDAPSGVSATDTLRLSVTAMTAGFGRGADLLAVDRDRLGTVAWSRPDFSDGNPLPSTLSKLAPTELPQGMTLPKDTPGLSIWVAPGNVPRNTYLRARLEDSTGAFFNATFIQSNKYDDYNEARSKSLAGQGWRQLHAPFPIRPYETWRGRGPQPPLLEPPFTLHTLWINLQQGGTTSGALFLDLLQADLHTGPIDVASFQELGAWHPLENPASPGLSALEVSQSVGRNSRKSLSFTWGPGNAPMRGIQVGPPGSPIPSLASKSFLMANEVQIGDSITVMLDSTPVPVTLVDKIDYFPTVDPRTTEFLVVDIYALLQHANVQTVRRLRPQGELWVRDGSGTLTLSNIESSVLNMRGTIGATYDSKALIQARTSDPLLTAGWAGLLALSFLTVVLASSSGLILYTYIDARERQGEFAMLRSLGFSNMQVNGVVWFNLTLVVCLGLAIGTWGGQWLGAILLPLLEVAEGGKRVTPPMILETNWSALLVAYSVLGAATAVTILALAWSISKMELQRVMRVQGG